MRLSHTTNLRRILLDIREINTLKYGYIHFLINFDVYMHSHFDVIICYAYFLFQDINGLFMELLKRL